MLAVALAAAPGGAQERAADRSATTDGLALPERTATATRNDEGDGATRRRMLFGAPPLIQFLIFVMSMLSSGERPKGICAPTPWRPSSFITM